MRHKLTNRRSTTPRAATRTRSKQGAQSRSGTDADEWGYDQHARVRCSTALKQPVVEAVELS